MNLNLILPLKKITINNKQLSIPKLGLKHYKSLKDVKSPDETLKIVLDEISPNLTKAEAKLVLIHLVEFNGKCKASFIYNNKTFTLADIYILPLKTYAYDGKIYSFKEAKLFDTFSSAKEILETLCTEKVDFGDMPAFVYKWADEIGKSIAIDLGDKIVYDDDILGLFE